MFALPTNRDENWRYANLRPLTKATPAAVPATESANDAVARRASLPGYEHWVFIDGVWVPSLSTPTRASTMYISRQDRFSGDAVEQLLDLELESAGIDFALARANVAHADGVLMLLVPESDQPLNVEITFVATQGAARGTSYPRVQVHSARNSRLSLIERHVSAGDADSLVNGAVDIGLAAGATVDHVRVQNCGEHASVYDTLVVNVGERANYRLRTVALGAASSRSTTFIRLAGRGARCELHAASIANGTQVHDMFAEIEHAAPDTVTREMFRGIATERGKLGFNGKIIVRANAFDADSDQSLKSLLTGTGAEAATRPQLEIYTDRVRAKHGATIGKLDEQMLFYLLSRGIERQTAQALLQWAFVEDAVSQIEPAPLRREIEALVSARLMEVSGLTGLLGETA